MHNLHFYVVKADSPQEACSEVEGLIESFGDENNWRTICGCVSEDNEVHDIGKGDIFGGRYIPSDINLTTIEAINNNVKGWLNTKNNHLRVIEKLKESPDFTNKEVWKIHDLWCLEQYVKDLYQQYNIEGFNVLTDDYFAYEYDQCGVTQYEGSEETTGKKYVVFIDMHS